MALVSFDFLIVSLSGYDLSGNVIYSVDPNGNRTDTTYDPANRPTHVKGPAVTDAENNDAMTRPETVSVYDRNGNITSVTDPRQVVTETQYDQWNRPRFVIANSNGSGADVLKTESRYDAGGNKLAVVLYNLSGGYIKPQVTSYAYDAMGRQTSQTRQSTGADKGT